MALERISGLSRGAQRLDGPAQREKARAAGSVARALLPFGGMIGSLFDRGSVPALDTLLRFAGARHRVIAGNVANVDTAGYRALDLPLARFDQAMAKAFRTGDFAPARELVEAEPTADAGTLKPGGNNVDLDLEMAKMVRNQSLYSMAAALLAQQFQMTRAAITGHVSA